MLKKRLKKLLFNKYFIISLVLIIIFSRIVSGYFSKAVDEYTTLTVRNFTERLVISSIQLKILDGIDDSDFLIEEYDSEGKICYAYLNTKKINKVRNDIADYTDTIVDDIMNNKELEIIKIPLGYFLGTKYLMDSSISIPLHIEVIGNQDVDILKKSEAIGINTTIFQIDLQITIDIVVVLPFQSKRIISSVTIPLAFEIMNNEIPYYISDFS